MASQPSRTIVSSDEEDEDEWSSRMLPFLLYSVVLDPDTDVTRDTASKRASVLVRLNGAIFLLVAILMRFVVVFAVVNEYLDLRSESNMYER